jgi:hypothetical protein
MTAKMKINYLLVQQRELSNFRILFFEAPRKAIGKNMTILSDYAKNHRGFCVTCGDRGRTIPGLYDKNNQNIATMLLFLCLALSYDFRVGMSTLWTRLWCSCGACGRPAGPVI